ncbi:MAG: hypothetical protein MI750_01025 [Xanthomonadales bacterium]|nr:hypothetical protein [Xanthomonadales bacterium]
MKTIRTVTALSLLAVTNIVLAGSGGGTGIPEAPPEQNIIEWLMGLMGIGL